MVDTIVLIPHYNDLEGLEKSLASISDIDPVDVLIVDDGSKIKPDQEILQKKFKQINNLIVLHSEPNHGQAYVENVGLKYIIELGKHKYIARLDSSDTSYPERFKIQKEYLEQNPDISLLGSHAMIIDLDGNNLYVAKMPLTHEIIRRKMHAHNCFLHSSIMYRVDALSKVGLYSVNYYANDDYDYWFRFIEKTLTANVDKCLVNIELNLKSLSRNKYRKELRARIRVLINYFSFKYFFNSLRGLFKAFTCYVIGIKASSKIVVLINKRSK